MLQEHLERIGWSEKRKLYEPFFVKAETCNEIANAQLSIIIIAWKYKSEIQECLESLKQQRDNCEIIFVNNGADEEAFVEIKKQVDKYIQLNTNTGDGVARNFGAVFATTPILCFLDDDALAAPNYVAAHVRQHRKYDIVGLRGKCLLKNPDNPLNKLGRHYLLGKEPYARFSDLEGNSSYKANSFYTVKGWDDRIFFGHSGIVLSKRLLEFSKPTQQIYSPECVIYHDYIENDSALKQKSAKHKDALEFIEKTYGSLNSIRNIWEPYLRDPSSIKVAKEC